MPFVEVVGSAGMEAPEQYGPGVVNVGVVDWVISIVRVVVEAHCPAAGVNV